jgi:ATPase subunit of ABC transporter with duplicated ATPase domains
MAYLRQDQFAYEDVRVLDVVMMGHAEMWACMQEKDAIYANPEATEDDYMHAAELEGRFRRIRRLHRRGARRRTAARRRHPTEQHGGPMSEVAPGWKLRVLLAQALFANPDILLLDEPTNNLDINTIRWLEDVLNERNSTMVIISHDRHFLNQVCTHMADLDYGTIKVYPGNYDDFMEASTRPASASQNANAKAKERIADLQDFVRRFSANKSKAKQATFPPEADRKAQAEDVKPSSASTRGSASTTTRRRKLHRQAVEIENLDFATIRAAPARSSQVHPVINAGDRWRSSARTVSARPPC